MPKHYKAFIGPTHSTSAKTALTCPRKHMLTNVFKLRPVGKLLWRSALEIGSTFHQIGKLYYTLPEICEDPQAWVFQMAFARHTENVASALEHATKGMFPDGTTVDDFTEKANNDFYLAAAMALMYFERYPPDLETYRPVLVEETVTVDHPTLGYIEGTLDLVLEERSTGNLWPHDYKTTGDDPSVVAAATPMDLQPYLYWALAAARFPDRIVSGFIHPFIRKHTLRFCPTGKDREGGFDGYLARVVKWYEEKEAKGDKCFAQSRMRFTSGKIPKDIHRRLLEAAEYHGRWPDPDESGEHPGAARCSDSHPGNDWPERSSSRNVSQTDRCWCQGRGRPARFHSTQDGGPGPEHGQT